MKESMQIQCDDCGQICDPESAKSVDGKPICLKCLYGDAKPLTIRPIGYVVNDKKRSSKGFGTTGSDISTIRLFSGIARFMKGLAEESHLTVLWQLHQAKPVRTVFSRGWDSKQVGPFASRTPDRLTPIAVTNVELIKVAGTELIVRGLDAINGTPVLDIKVALQSLK
jgi:tRNA (adenine37-N6)-methyltransferase